ncbi:MAG TPA: VTT domain-containing protein [Gemmatimonadaceae bacterium]
MFEFISQFFDRLQDLPALVEWAGLIGLTIIIFVETGIFAGFFLPGDSLLVTAGLLIASGLQIDLVVLGVILNIAAVAGDACNYWFGRLVGRRIYTWKDSLFFKRRHLEKAHEFYERHGAKTIVIARFVPIIRTFAPLVAGVANMNYRRFAIFNVLGGTMWIWMMLLAGYYLGRMVPGIDRHLELVIIVVIFLSILPGIIGWWRERRRAVIPPQMGNAPAEPAVAGEGSEP